MKKILYTFFSSLWLLALFSLPVRADQITHTVNFTPDSVYFEWELIDTVEYSVVYYSGLFSTGQPGAPELPFMYLQFSVPYDAENLAVQTSNQSSRLMSVPHKILPASEGISVNDTIIPPIVMDTAMYASNSYLPSNNAEIISDSYYMGENRVVTVKVLPMRYSAGRNRIRFYDDVTISLSYNRANGNQLPANMSVQSNQALRQQSWDELKTRVVNPGQVEGFAPVSTNPQQLQSPIPEYMADSIWIDERFITQLSNSCEYMIVTTRDLAPSFRRLAALKRQKGYTVGIRCIEDILADNMVQNGDKRKKKDGTVTYINDSAGKLREYLRLNHSLYGTKYVLLAGTEIPIRYGFKESTSSNQKLNIPTDWYFCDLTTNWNTNGNSSYGENSQYSYWEQFDYEAELFVGRLMVENEEEVKNYTDKLLKYELNPGNGNSEYLSRGLVVTGSVDRYFTKPCAILRDSLSAIYNQIDSLVDVDSFTPSGSDVVNTINQINYGFIAVIGHGSPHNICVNDDSTSNPKVFTQKRHLRNKYTPGRDAGETANGLDCLRNSKYPSVFYTYSCTNMPFDIYTEGNHTFTGYNMGQEFTLGSNRGGVAFLGNTREGYISDSTKLTASPLLMSHFFDELKSGVFNVGKAEAYSKRLRIINNPGSVYYPMLHNLMGEPEFPIWTTNPVPFQNITISRTNNTITVSGLPVGEKCVVGICGNSGYAIYKSSTTGSLTFDNIYPNTTLMVTSNQHLPYIAPTILQNTTIVNSQYVIASDYTAGNHVDSGRLSGDVIIKSGVDYAVEHTGTVVFAPGFKIEKGARFSTIKSQN